MKRGLRIICGVTVTCYSFGGFQTQEKLLESEKHRKQLIEELQNVKQVSRVGWEDCRDGGAHGVQCLRISMDPFVCNSV